MFYDEYRHFYPPPRTEPEVRAIMLYVRCREGLCVCGLALMVAGIQEEGRCASRNL